MQPNPTSGICSLTVSSAEQLDIFLDFCPKIGIGALTKSFLQAPLSGISTSTKSFLHKTAEIIFNVLKAQK
jgi:hypothetical protein